MPRGVYERKSKKTNEPIVDIGGFFPDTDETDEEILDKIGERFEILEALCRASIAGDTKALIVSGPPGLGKSYTVETELDEWDPNAETYTIVKGFVRATGLYKLLYQHRGANNVIAFDDADAIFFDDVSLNILKTVCDTTEKRVVSWLTESIMIDEESGDRIPRKFEFEGTIIFITNLDFDRYVEKQHRLAPHLQALISRSHYVDLAMKTRRDYVLRIKQVIEAGMLTRKGLSAQQEADVMEFIEENRNNLRELSLRMAIKIAILRKVYPDKWDRMAMVTCCKNI